jgi:hypothetical protein
VEDLGLDKEVFRVVQKFGAANIVVTKLCVLREDDQ